MQHGVIVRLYAGFDRMGFNFLHYRIKTRDVFWLRPPAPSVLRSESKNMVRIEMLRQFDLSCVIESCRTPWCLLTRVLHSRL